MSDAISEFVDTVYESYHTLKDIYCTGATREYLEEKVSELEQIIPKTTNKSKNVERSIYSFFTYASIISNSTKNSKSTSEGIGFSVLKEYEKAAKQVTKEHFDAVEKKAVDMKALFEMCECDKEDDEYAFNIDKACEHLVTAYENIIQAEEEKLPESIYEAYCKINHTYVERLKEWINGLEVEFGNRWEITKREIIKRTIIKRTK